MGSRRRRCGWACSLLGCSSAPSPALPPAPAPEQDGLQRALVHAVPLLTRLLALLPNLQVGAGAQGRCERVRQASRCTEAGSQERAGPGALPCMVAVGNARAPTTARPTACPPHRLPAQARACTVEGAPTSLVSCRYCTVRVLAAAAAWRSRDRRRYSGSSWTCKGQGSGELGPAPQPVAGHPPIRQSCPAARAPCRRRRRAGRAASPPHQTSATPCPRRLAWVQRGGHGRHGGLMVGRQAPAAVRRQPALLLPARAAAPPHPASASRRAPISPPRSEKASMGSANLVVLRST